MLILDGPAAAVMTFSRDGDQLITGSFDGQVQIWHPPIQNTLPSVHKGRITGLAISPDGALLATGSAAGAFHLWDYRGSKLPTEVGEGLRSPHGITGLAFVKNDLLAVGTGDLTQSVSTPRGFFLWNLATKKQQSMRIDTGYTMVGVRSLTVSPQRGLLIWCTDRGAVIVWDTAKPDPIRFSLKAPARSMAISPDARLLAVAVDWKITIFDLLEKRETSTVTGHKGVVSSVAYSPDGRTLMSASWDKTVRWWDALSGRELQTFTWPIGQIASAIYAPDGLRAAAAGSDGKIVIWDVDH